MAFNLLGPNKKLSQLIAQSWLDGQEVSFDKQFLIDNHLLSENEAEYVEINVDTTPSGPPYIGKIEGMLGGGGYLMYIPYPNRPSEVTNEELNHWVSSPVDSAPYTPFEISQWIPYTC
jgi:hypothetical protein